MRRHLLELTLGREPPAHVLIDEDVPRLEEQFAGAELRRVLVLAVGTDVVRSPLHQHRVRFRRVIRDEDGCHQLHAVPHRHHVLVLGVVQPDVTFGLLNFLGDRET